VCRRLNDEYKNHNARQTHSITPTTVTILKKISPIPSLACARLITFRAIRMPHLITLADIPTKHRRHNSNDGIAIIHSGAPPWPQHSSPAARLSHHRADRLDAKTLPKTQRRQGCEAARFSSPDVSPPASLIGCRACRSDECHSASTVYLLSCDCTPSSAPLPTVCWCSS
jgi:hypothetical protein